jgi:hypothetical protein
LKHVLSLLLHLINNNMNMSLVKWEYRYLLWKEWPVILHSHRKYFKIFVGYWLSQVQLTGILKLHLQNLSSCNIDFTRTDFWLHERSLPSNLIDSFSLKHYSYWYTLCYDQPSYSEPGYFFWLLWYHSCDNLRDKIKSSKPTSFCCLSKSVILFWRIKSNNFLNSFLLPE